MAKKQSGIMLYNEMLENLCQTLSAEEVVKMLRAAMAFEIDGIEPEQEAFSQMGKVCWSFIRPALKRDAENYQDKVKKRKEAADARWAKDRAIKDANDANALSAMQTMPTTPTPTPSSPYSTPTGWNAFAYPTLEEVEEYVLSIGGEAFAAELFYSKYSHDNWHCGLEPIKDWRKLAKTWVSYYKRKAASQTKHPASAWDNYESF